MPVIFGKEIPTKTLWIGGGLMAAAVALVVFLRARAANAAAAVAPAAQQDTSGYGGGGGMTVSAPTDQAASAYQDQLQNAQLQAQNIANQYQQQLMQQQQTQFAFQQKQQELLAPAMQAEEQSELAAKTHYFEHVAKGPIGCPGNTVLYTGPNDVQYCRQKTSGGFLGIPIGDASRALQNFVSGVEAAAPTIGYQTAQEAASYYTGKLFPTGTRQGSQQASRPPQATVPFAPQTNPIPAGPTPSPMPNNPMAGIGYEVA